MENQNQIFIKKFVNYLNIEEDKTDLDLNAVIAMSELLIEDVGVNFTKKEQKQLVNILNSNQVVNCKNTIDDITFKCRVSKSSNNYILTVVNEEEDNRLTHDDFMILLSTNYCLDKDFIKHIDSIMTKDFFNAYFDSSEQMNEQYALAWLDNYKTKWTWRNK
jgi:hypothetical protein